MFRKQANRHLLLLILERTSLQKKSTLFNQVCIPDLYHSSIEELQELERGWGDDSDLDLDVINSLEIEPLSNDPTQDPIVPELKHEEASEEDPSVPPAQEVSPSLLTTESSSRPQYLNEKDTNAVFISVSFFNDFLVG